MGSRWGYCQRVWALTQFFWGFNHADAIGRGHDPTVPPFKFTKDLTKKFLFWADSGDLKVKNVNFFKCCCHGGTNPTGTYRTLSLLKSRATRTFKAGVLRHADLYSSKTRGAYSLLLWVLNMRFMRNSPLLRFSISQLCSIIATLKINGR